MFSSTFLVNFQRWGVREITKEILYDNLTVTNIDYIVVFLFFIVMPYCLIGSPVVNFHTAVDY